MIQQNVGKVVQIIGAVLDIRFDAEHLPSLKNAIIIKTAKMINKIVNAVNERFLAFTDILSPLLII